MALAQGKTSRRRKGNRRSHHRLQPPTLMECPNCHKEKLTHAACPACGFYKGRQVARPHED